LSSSDLSAGVLVVSDSVYEGKASDVSGDLCGRALSSRGFKVVYYSVVPNREGDLERAIRECLSVSDVCVTIGGTGPSKRDKTIEVAGRISEKVFPGFGEAFRARTRELEGLAKSVATRSELFSIGEKLLLCLPGSPSAVQLGMEIFLEAAPHLIEELRRAGEPHRHPGKHYPNANF